MNVEKLENLDITEVITKFTSLTPVTAAISSSLGRVIDLVGATLDLDITSAMELCCCK